MKTVRYYDARGREKFATAGQIVPAGSYREAPGKAPELLREPALVIERTDEGNPYEEEDSGTRWLALETESERKARAARIEADNAECRQRAAEMDALVARAAAAIAAAGAQGIAPGQVVAESCYDERAFPQAIARITRKNREYAIKKWSAAAGAGWECGAMEEQWGMTNRGGAWSSEWGQERSALGKRWQWAKWAEEILSGGDDDVSTACDAMRAKAAAKAAAEAEAKAAAEVAAKAEADAAKAAALKAAGVRQAEIAAALQSKAEEKRLRDIATIRREWRTINSVSWRARSAARGGRCGYHPDSLALLDKIEAAQQKANQLREAREWRERDADEERRTLAEKAACAAKDQVKARFNTAAWGALDSIKI